MSNLERRMQELTGGNVLDTATMLESVKEGNVGDRSASKEDLEQADSPALTAMPSLN